MVRQGEFSSKNIKEIVCLWAMSIYIDIALSRGCAREETGWMFLERWFYGV